MAEGRGQTPGDLMSMSKPTDGELGQEGLSFANALRDCLVCGAIWLSPDQRSVTLTREAAHLLGLDPEQALQTPLTSLPEPLQAIAREVFSSASPVTERDLELRVPGRAPLLLRVSAS